MLFLLFYKLIVEQVFPFWVVEEDRAYEWMEAVQNQLHPIIKQGPWSCFCGAK